MRWQDIEGWFDFQDLYRQMVRQANETAHFVEIGAWMGRSTAFLGQEIKASGKNIQLHVVDTWEGSPEKVHRRRLAKLQDEGKTLFDVFSHNMAACGVDQVVTPVRSDSVSAAEFYLDRGLDFVFIDGEHTYKAVCADIDAWLPKVKPGGVLAGHDLPHGPVRDAVSDKLGADFRKSGPRSWTYIVPGY